jgi:hypothetical protein
LPVKKPFGSFLFSFLAFYPEPVTAALRQRSVPPTSQRYSVAVATPGCITVAAAFFARFAAPFFAALREAFTGAFFAIVFLAAGACLAFAAVFAAARFAAQRFFNAATIAALPAALSVRFGFVDSGVAFDVGAECSTAGFFAVPEDDRKLTASFARVTAAFAS